jgi:hypothetical protein
MGLSQGVKRLVRTRRDRGACEQLPITWRINGYRTSLLVWTRDEWAKLETHPSDAQYHPSGIWCALRIG